MKLCEIFQKWNTDPKTELFFVNDFTFCVAVILSAQSTDKSVNNITRHLFEIVDTPKKILSLGEEGLRKYIRSIGLHNGKAKKLMMISEILIRLFDSKIPRNREILETLPGIGRKSANVILNQLYDYPYIAVDTHVSRVSNRIGLSNSIVPLRIEKDLTEKIPQEFHKNISNWLILHGRYVCTSRNQKCDQCSVKNICEMYIQRL